MLTKTSLLLLPLGPALASAGLLSNVKWLASERRAVKCGVKGYADTDNNYFWSASKKLASYAACSARCKGDTRCESFGYDDRVCMLFDEALAGNFETDRKSDLTFYDASCNGAATSTATGRSRTTKTRTLSTQAPTAAMPTVTVPAVTSISNLTTSYTPVAGATSGGAGLISLVANSTSATDAAMATASAATAQIKLLSDSASIAESPLAVTPVTNAANANGTGALTSSNSTSPSSSSSSSSSSVTIPDGCDIPTSFTVTSLTWFDSANNLDCVNPNYANGSQVCWDVTQQQLCDPAASPDAATTCTCAPYCWPGTPAVARQPYGYGPPDTVSITLGGSGAAGAGLGNGTCRQSNPPDAGTTQGLEPDAEVGDGPVDCGSSILDILSFYGSSSSSGLGANGTVGRIEFSPPAVECGGKAAEYGASFPLVCESDAGGNATCTASTPLTLSLIGFSS